MRMRSHERRREGAGRVEADCSTIRGKRRWDVVTELHDPAGEVTHQRSTEHRGGGRNAGEYRQPPDGGHPLARGEEGGDQQEQDFIEREEADDFLLHRHFRARDRAVEDASDRSEHRREHDAHGDPQHRVADLICMTCKASNAIKPTIPISRPWRYITFA